MPLEVIEAGDPAPPFLDILRSTTRRTVLRREVLLEPGEPYRQYRIDETVRSLQIFQQLNQRSELGGEGRLRGYPSMAFLGANLLLQHRDALAARRAPLVSARYRALLRRGDAFDSGARIPPKSSAGLGVRTLFPQLDRKVFRFDVAFPLVRGSGAGPIGFYLAFSQAFGSAAVLPPGAAPVQAILNPLGGALGQ